MLTIKKRVFYILLIIGTLLLIPFIGMQVSTEVNWSSFDFIVAAIVLLTVGFVFELIMRTIHKKTTKVILIIGLAILFLLTWVEIAVGLFGTPLAGS